MTPLHELAAELGIERVWSSIDGREHTIGDETLLALCRALGQDVDRHDDAADALAAMRTARVTAGVDPLSVAWDDAPPVLTLYRRAQHVDEPFDIVVEHDGDVGPGPGASAGGGGERGWDQRSAVVRDVRATPIEDVVAVHVELAGALAPGAHPFAARGTGLDGRGTILAAPRRPTAPPARTWGLFAPIYALHDPTRPAAGDFGTLRRFGAWAAGTGASVIGTLPMLAAFVGHGAEPRDPSPYAPVSRRFWNEAFLDPNAIDPRLDVDAGIARDPRVADVAAQSARVRAALEPLVPVAAFSAPFRTWLATRSDVVAYARFRAEREGSGGAGARYHEVAQWWCEEQLAALAREFETRGQSLYLDLPIGAHRDGFDVATAGELFVRDASVGAPPDDFQPGGQDWGFPPVNPAVARADGHAQFRAALTTHFRFAHVLRIDHVMGLHRLWFVPEGAGATEGAYVRSDADALWAACCLLAYRHRATIVGENLGTVPEETNRALDAHGALKMWVLPFASRADDPLRMPGSDELACLDTHDLAPYAAWWRDLPDAHRDAFVAHLRANGALDDDAPDDARAVLAALLQWLGRSDASLVLATLEDLWLETEPQNRPGTPADANFRHRGRHGLDELAAPDDPTGARALLRILDDARSRAHQPMPS